MLINDPAAGGRSLAEILVHLRCHQCRGREINVHLTETALPPDVIGDVRPGWSILLHKASRAVLVLMVVSDPTFPTATLLQVEADREGCPFRGFYSFWDKKSLTAWGVKLYLLASQRWATGR